MMLLSHNHAHFNPATAGAVVALDARFLTGFADGDPVGTWAGRAGTSINASSSGPARPLFTIGISEIGGQPAARFDGADDIMTLGVGLQHEEHLTLVVLRATAPSYGTLWFDGNGRVCLKLSGSQWGTYLASFADGPAGEDFPLNSGQIVGNSGGGSTCKLRRNGTLIATVSDDLGDPAQQSSIGADSSYGRHLQADIAAHVAWASTVSDALRRRVEQSLAFSFRIACA